MKNLVFLISQPRSGSTLLQAILGGHEDILTGSEPWIALPFIYALKSEGSEYEFNGRWAKRAMNEFFNANCINEEFRLSALNPFLSSFYQKALEKSEKKIFLDKTPRYYEIASELAQIFREARFIVLYRHPLAVLLSILNTWVKGEVDILYYYSRDLLVAPLKLIDFVANNRDRVCLVGYEELVQRPKDSIQKLCNDFGISYSESLLNYSADTNWAFGDKNYKMKSAPDPLSAHTWKAPLPDKRARNFCAYYLEDLGEDIFNSLGYDFAEAKTHIETFKPHNADRKTWETLMHGKYIVSVEEQRQRVRKKLKRNFFHNLLRTLKT